MLKDFKQDGAIFYLEELKQNLAPAKLQDFYHNNKPIESMPFLAQSYTTNRYILMRVNEHFPTPLIKYMIRENRVFIFKK